MNLKRWAIIITLLAALWPRSAAAQAPYVRFEPPWTCGDCVPGGNQVPLMEYPPDPSGGPGDILWPFRWLGVWLWNESIRPVLCYAAIALQAIADFLSAIANGFVAAYNRLLLIIIAVLDWAQSVLNWVAELSSWARLQFWLVNGTADALFMLFSDLYEFLLELLILISIIGQNIGDLLSYFVGLIYFLISSVFNAIATPETPPQIAQIADFFLFNMVIDGLWAWADSQLGWVYYGFIGVAYVRFAVWAAKELSSLNS